MIQVKATASSYTNKIYVVFDKHEYVDKYELYRDGVKVAEYDETNQSAFAQPTLFDHDHHTNLFKKESSHQLMYEDADVRRYREYSYSVKYYHGDESWNTNMVHITLQ